MGKTKNRDKCLRIHLKEVCLIRKCTVDVTKGIQDLAKSSGIEDYVSLVQAVGTVICRLPKEVEEQNKRIESLEEMTVNLSKQVADQTMTLEI